MADASELSFLDFYRDELGALREQAAEFARSHPSLARELGLSEGYSGDPHVELLLQSFAYLTGRLQYQRETERAAIPNGLLAHLYPHLEGPLPPMAVAEVLVNPKNFKSGSVLKAGREFFAEFERARGLSAKCRFRTCFHTPLWPLQVRAVRQEPIEGSGIETPPRDSQSLLRVTIETTAASDLRIGALRMDTLRFFLHGRDAASFPLYDLLSARLLAVGTQDARHDRTSPLLPPAHWRWLGFSEDEGALPVRSATHPGYRLVQEYFAFPEKFLFIEVSGLDTLDAAEELDVLFLLDSPMDAGPKVAPDALKLNCVPLVNLFGQSLEPIGLDHRRHEYRLEGDRGNHRYCEVYSVEELTAIRSGESPRRIAPYFELDPTGMNAEPRYFYALRRAESTMRDVDGTELLVSFLDLDLDGFRPADETVGGRSLCTNRRLAERLRLHERLQLDGPGPVTGARLVTKPTPHANPALIGPEPWRLVSQLSLNYLSLSECTHGLSALKAILKLHAGSANPESIRQIDSITAVSTASRTLPFGIDPGEGPCRGTVVTLHIDEQRFGSGSVLLFGEVLRRFVALYANINTFSQLCLESHQRRGLLREWTPMAGEQELSERLSISGSEVPWPPLPGERPVL